MHEEIKESVTLAIETAVAGGSLSLMKDDRELDLWIGDDEVSRSEDLLIGISDLLARNSIERSDLRLIAVSTGPGSYTGIRVGIATALGLKNSLGIPCAGFQILEAMGAAFGPHRPQIVSAIPIGRGEVCWQTLGPDGPGELLVEKESRFAEYLASDTSMAAVLHEKVFRVLVDNNGVDAAGVKNAGTGLARYVGVAARSTEAGTGLMPTYVRDFI